MEAAKSAVNKIIHRDGQHDTHVDETVNPAVTSETVKPHRHEEVTTAVDKEVHQDHHHTTVQPIKDKQVLPEQHHHRQLPVQEKEIHHGDDSHIHRAVDAEVAQFKDSSRTLNTTHSGSQAPAVAGEHVHHHVHENVQPVIHKETIQPEVVHTTAPVHETHQAPAEHHGMSVLPTKTLNEVKHVGHTLTGGAHREEHYAGHPRKYDESMQVEQSEADKNFTRHDGLHDADSRLGGTTTTTTGSGGIERSAIHRTNIGDFADQSQGSNTTVDHGSNDTKHRISRQGQSESGNLSTATQAHHDGSPSNRDYNHGQTHHEGHGTTNQTHHGTARDNIDPNTDQSVQHGTQSRDPAVIDDKLEKKLTGSGVDGSHSALFGLTPDGHKYEDTSHGTTPLKPAHGGGGNGNGANPQGGQEKLAEQMNDARVLEKLHGQNVSDSGSAKPGFGAPGGSQGFGNVRPEEHGVTEKIENKLDPTTDADGDGKKGVLS